MACISAQSEPVGGGINNSPATSATPRILDCAGWTLHDYQVVNSTNLVAANSPPWSAVRARTQTAGRGRYERSWVSDEGGLWLSAVVPVGGAESARLLPLLAGLALCRVLQDLELRAVRMRWPNDLLVNDRKLAGILVDSFCPNAAVIGMGVNVQNHPEVCNTKLCRQTARLADLIPNPPGLDELTALVLRSIRNEMESFTASGFVLPIARVNGLWGPPRSVELELDGDHRRGTFTGVDSEGRLGLWGLDGTLIFYSAHQVRHLTELES